MFQEKFMKIKKTQKIPIYKYVNSRRYSENRKNADGPQRAANEFHRREAEDSMRFAPARMKP